VWVAVLGRGAGITCLVTVVCVRVQDTKSCLYAASDKGKLEVVKYLHEAGGKELLMLTDKVSACSVRVWCVCVSARFGGVCAFVCICVFVCVYMYICGRVRVRAGFVDMYML
jgi:hypothetical protein